MKVYKAKDEDVDLCDSCQECYGACAPEIIIDNGFGAVNICSDYEPIGIEIIENYEEGE